MKRNLPLLNSVPFLRQVSLLRVLPVMFVTGVTAFAAFAGGKVSEYHEAVVNLAEKAEEGDPKSIFELAKLHDSGFDTIPKDSLRSSALYLEAAHMNYAPAMNFVGFRYYNGDGLRQDTDSALYWIRRAADAGDITAAANLGYLLTESPLIAHDTEEAVKWLTIASEAGVVDAQLHLSQLQKEVWESLPLDSTFNTGVRYYVGSAPIVGVKLIELSAREGNPKAIALMGDAYSKGRGVAYDHQKSIRYFLEAARGGNAPAQFILGELLDIFPDALSLEEFSPAPEETTAEYWYEKAAESGITDSEEAFSALLSNPE